MINKKRMFYVGGCVRDEFLGKVPNDVDVMIVGYTYDEAKAQFGEPVGHGFPVFLWKHPVHGTVEVALARKEKSTGNGYKDFICDFGPDVTVEEDLKRRDLTINAIAKDVETGEIVDPYGGVEDIKNRVLRAVNPDAFVEDPLRVFRMARFAAQLDFNVEPETLELAKAMVDKFKHLPSERIWKETEKALKSKHPWRYFEVLRDVGGLSYWFPEVEALVGVPQKYHEEDAFEHTMLVMRELVKQNARPELIFAGLCHDLGKGNTPLDILPHHYKHEQRSVELIKQMSRRIHMPKLYIQVAMFIAENHMKFHKVLEMKPGKLIKLMDGIKKSKVTVEECCMFVTADVNGRKGYCDKDVDGYVKRLKLVDEVYSSVTGRVVKEVHPDVDGKNFGAVMSQMRVNLLKERI